MFIQINFTNFQEVQNQFNGLGSDYLNGSQIMEDIIKQVNEDDNIIHRTILVTVEPKNFDSAWAQFSLVSYSVDYKKQEESLLYEYNGTAK